MSIERCENCGRSFNSNEESGILGMGGPVYQMIGNNWFCRNKCMLQYHQKRRQAKAEKAGENATIPTEAASAPETKTGGKGLGLGSMMKGAMTGMVPGSKDPKKEQLDEVTNMMFGDDTTEAQNNLNRLLIIGKNAKGGGIPAMGMTNNKQIRAAVKEKMEFGIMRLRSAGLTDEADYFQKKLGEIK